MIAWINELTDLPNWQYNIFDSDFVFQWKYAKLLTGQDVTPLMVDWVRVDSNTNSAILINLLFSVLMKSDTMLKNQIRLAQFQP